MRGGLRGAALLGALVLLGALAGPAASVDAVLRYHDTADPNVPKFRYLNGTALSAERDLVTLGATSKHFAQIVAGPVRNEFVAVAVQGGGELRAQVWRDAAKSWGDTVTLTATGPGTGYAAVAVAFERSSGEALVVYSDNTATPKYRTWDGASWSSATAITVGTTGIVQQVRLASKVGTDTIALVVGDANSDLYALVWDGSAWGNGATLTTTSGTMTDGPFDLAWESASGELLVAYDNAAATVKYRTWSSGAGWSAENTGPNVGNGQTVEWVRLVAGAGDTVFLGVQDSGPHVELAEWSGSAWGAVTQATNKATTLAARTFDLAVEGTSGEALVVYGEDQGASKDLLRYRTYTTSWSAQANALDTSTASDLPQWVALVPDPRSNVVASLHTDNGNRVGYLRWTGSAWANATEVETASDKAALNLAGAFRRTTPGLPWVDTDGTYSWGSEAFGSVDTLQSPGQLEFSDGVTGQVYDADGTPASGTWGQWAAVPGALNVASGVGPQLAGRYLKAENLGTADVAETWTFEACGENGEADVSHVKLVSTNTVLNDAADGSDGNGHAVTATERSTTAKPATGPGITADGYAVWNPAATGADCVAVQFRHTWDGAPTGTYTQTAQARSSGGTWGRSLAAHQDTTAFDTSATATLDFTPSVFTGVLDSLFQVDLDGRIDFAWHVGTETDPSTVATWEGSSANDADGAIAVAVNTVGHVVWVSYTLDLVTPAGLAVLRDQSYTAAFTWG